MSTKKRRVGRPPSEIGVPPPIPIRFPDEMLEAVDALLAKTPDIMGRSAMIRRLVQEALDARKNGGRK